MTFNVDFFAGIQTTADVEPEDGLGSEMDLLEATKWQPAAINKKNENTNTTQQIIEGDPSEIQ